MNLYEDIKQIINRDIAESEDVFNSYLARLEEGDLTRDENPLTHFGVFFLPFNKQENKVFLVHHKKSGLWIFPGGHIDKGEKLFDALNREIKEEIGVEAAFNEYPKPFLLTAISINNKGHACKMHYDIWHLWETDGLDFKIDPIEFHETKWFTFKEARERVVNEQTLMAIEKLEKTIL